MKLKSEKLLKILSMIIFISYLILIIWIIMFKCNLIESITKTYEYYKVQSLHERFTLYLIPFIDYFEGQFVTEWQTLLKDDLLNIIIFIPLGLYLTFFNKKYRLLKVCLIALCISIFFELFQLFSLIGSFNVKDIITNVLGSIIGYFICLLLYKEKNNSIKIMILNILSIVVIFILVPIALYGIFNTLRYSTFYFNILIRNL